MATKYILDPSGKIIQVVNGKIKEFTVNESEIDEFGNTINSTFFPDENQQQEEVLSPVKTDPQNTNYYVNANKGKSLETSLLNTGKINSEGIGPLVEVDSTELDYIIDKNSSNDASFGFIDDEGNTKVSSTTRNAYLPFNSFAEDQTGKKPKVFADEFEMLTGLRYRNDEQPDAFENALFMLTYIAESLVRIIAVEAIVIANRAINVTVNDSGNQSETAERYSLKLGKYDFTEFDIFTKYIFNVLNYPHDSSSLLERTGAYFLGMSAWLSPDSIVDLNNIFKERRNLTKYTNSLDQATEVFDKKFFPSAELFVPMIYSSAEVLVNALLSTNSVNRSRLLIRKFYKEKHWHNNILYSAKSRNDILDFFSDLNYYYFKFYIERVHIGLTLLKKYFYDDTYLRLRQKDSPLNRVSASRSTIGINQKIEVDEENKDSFFGSWNYNQTNQLGKFKARQPTSVRALPQAFNLNFSFLRSLVLNGKETIDLGQDLLQNFYRSEERRLPASLVEEIEHHLEAEYMPFYFHDLRTNEIISFHAFIESIGDSFSPEYNSASGFGRIDDVKSYVKTTRNINLSFIVAATSEADHDLMWYQINKIVAMVYPQWSDAFEASTYNFQTGKSSPANFKYPFTQVPTASPLIRLRVGDVIKSNYSRTVLSRLHGVGDREQDLLTTNSDGQEAIEERNEAIASQKDDINAFNKELASSKSRLFEIDEEYLNNKKNTDTDKEILLRQAKIEQEIQEDTQEQIDNAKSNIANLSPVNPALGLNVVNDIMIKPNKAYFLLPGLYRQVSGNNSVVESLGLGSIDLENLTKSKSIKVETEILVEVKSLENEYATVKILNTPFINVYVVADINKIRAIDKTHITDVELDPLLNSTNDLMSPEINVEAEGGMKLSNNPITKSYESGMSRGLAGFITNLDVSYNESTWETSRIGSKAPMLVKINIGFSPIHDVPPGIDHNGMLRAPIYNVGRINNEFFGDPYDRDAGHGTGREKSLQKYNEIYKKTHKK